LGWAGAAMVNIAMTKAAEATMTKLRMVAFPVRVVDLTSAKVRAGRTPDASGGFGRPQR
jgi:hypothetical protein